MVSPMSSPPMSSPVARHPGRRKECGDRAADLPAPAVHSRLVGQVVEQWRHEALWRAGYDAEAAVVLAASHDVDLHLAVDLLERGCTQELALQILL